MLCVSPCRRGGFATSHCLRDGFGPAAPSCDSRRERHGPAAFSRPQGATRLSSQDAARLVSQAWRLRRQLSLTRWVGAYGLKSRLTPRNTRTTILPSYPKSSGGPAVPTPYVSLYLYIVMLKWIFWRWPARGVFGKFAGVRLLVFACFLLIIGILHEMLYKNQNIIENFDGCL